MKIVHIIGGLGNQMFQYALLIALRGRFGQEIKADISSFKNYGLHNGYELQKVFGITPSLASRQDLSKLTYYAPSYAIQRVVRKLLPHRKTECIESKRGDYIATVLTDPSDKYYEGYWQNYKYFDKYYPKICEEFSFKTDNLNADNQELVSSILSFPSNYVSIHIRRGDYIKNTRFGGLCDISYYQSAIEEVKRINNNKNIHFLIFSNDMEWCRLNLESTYGKYIYVDWNKGSTSYIDMYLMTLCGTNIIANSSFSWWGAYLNRNQEKVVIAPKKWTNDVVAFNRQLPDWILL